MKTVTTYIFVLLSLLLAANCLLYYYYQISFAGYYSDVILFWLWFFTSIIIIVLFWKKMMAKLFLTAIILTLIGSALLVTPLHALAFSMTPAGLILEKQLNENYRVQIVDYSVFNHPWLEVIAKKGVLEQKVFTCTEMNISHATGNNIAVKFDVQLRPNVKISQAKDIIFNNETDTALTLTLFYGGPNKTIRFNKADGKISLIKQ